MNVNPKLNFFRGKQQRPITELEDLSRLAKQTNNCKHKSGVVQQACEKQDFVLYFQLAYSDWKKQVYII